MIERNELESRLAGVRPPGLNILVFQHIASEHPGSFRDVMAARGAVMTQIELDEGAALPPPAGFDALLVMGGPMDVWQEDANPWLAAEKQFIRDWVAAQKPYLGICLGAQLLAEACGGAVGPMATPEVGVTTMAVVPDRLFEGVALNFPCLQWHGAEVKKLPKAGRLLATNAASPVQAFAIGQHAFGLQFHIELTASTATEWGALPEYAAALERVKGPGALPVLQAQIARVFPALHDAAATLFGNFLDIAQTAAPAAAT